MSPRLEPSRRTIRLLVEYDGSAYVGWQRQKKGPTIQEMLERAIASVTGVRSVVHGSGRTDAGVHAAGQVAHFETRSVLAASVLKRAINAHLPRDIVVLEAEDAPGEFHARFLAESKTYRYRIRNVETRGALDRHMAWHIPRTLDVAAMRRAASCLVGRRDLRCFVAEGGRPRDAVRTVKSLDIRRSEPYILVTIEADGFLYKVVRAIVGTLVWVGSGKISVKEFREIVDSRDRRRAGPTAPSRGLCLLSVAYPCASRSPSRRPASNSFGERKSPPAAHRDATRTRRIGESHRHRAER